MVALVVKLPLRRNYVLNQKVIHWGTFGQMVRHEFHTTIVAKNHPLPM